MRITNKIIQNNSLRNINRNKIMQDALNQQMSSQKKINRPSDDPVIAIRALRLRTNVSQITQYYEKNVPDADSWLKSTEDAIAAITEVLTEMKKQATSGSNSDLKLEDRQTILDQLKELRDEIYATGDADYAGRFLFTGYRTDTSLSFTEDTNLKYTITEQLKNSKIDKITHVETGLLPDLNESNFDDTGLEDIDENGIDATNYYRIRLAYDDLDAVDVNIKTSAGDVTADHMSLYDTPDPYAFMKLPTNRDKVIVIKETGELILGQDAYDDMMALKDNPSTPDDEGEIQITYEKSSWKKGNLRPQHYFACTTTDGGKKIDYNADYLNGNVNKQAIEIDVGFNQTIRVNTTADEVFKHDIGRDVDDMISVMQQAVDMEKTVKKLESMLKSEDFTDAQKVLIETQLTAANKAFTLIKDKTQGLFEGAITKMQGHIDTTTFAETTAGTRGKKLELINNRLMSQQTTFETLQSANEDADLPTLAIRLGSIQLTYEAALMASGKILQSSLLNFI